jgi:hypothetical protein
MMPFIAVSFSVEMNSGVWINWLLFSIEKPQQNWRIIMSKSLYAGQTNRLLGYPDDARLLIINADDFGLCHTINSGIF